MTYFGKIIYLDETKDKLAKKEMNVVFKAKNIYEAEIRLGNYANKKWKDWRYELQLVDRVLR